MPELSPGMSTPLAALWSHPIHRLLLLAAVAELIMVGLQVLVLCAQMLRMERRRRLRLRLAAALEDALMDAAFSGVERVFWVRLARRWPRDVVRELLSDHLLRASGDYLVGLRAIYRALGFLEEDLGYLRSRIRRRRVLALRHLHRVAGSDEVPALLATRGDEHVVRVMAVQVMARVGSPEDMVGLLRDLRLPQRLMEQPIGGMLHHMPALQLEALLRHWGELVCPAVRRLVLVTAARTTPAACLSTVAVAASSRLPEDRIGAAVAAGLLPPRFGVPWLVELLSDEAWQVRAQAAAALGSSADPLAAAPLETVLGDMEFWVRRNAAEALVRLGADGRRRLITVAARSRSDPGAGSARETLQRLDLWRAGAAG